MIRYPNGLVAMRGDRVVSDGTPAVVHDIVDSEGKQAEWGLDTMGLMLDTSDIGLVFESVISIDWDCFEFVARAFEDK